MKKSLLSLVVFIVALGLIAPGASAEWCHTYNNVKVMTRNLYLGADIFYVFQVGLEDPAAIPDAVAQIYDTMLYTNFGARAEAIADEIAINSPDVIGLQEVSTYYKQTPGDFFIGNPEKAETVVIDFYTVLNDALKDRGLSYNAFRIDNADVELPMVDSQSPTGFSDVRLVDHDVILVRSELPARKVLARNFRFNLEANLGGSDLEFTRGFVIVDVTKDSEIFRVVDTHLEVGSEPGSIFRFFQSAQMQELLRTLGFLARIPILGNWPIIMLGDFNSSPEDVPGLAYHPDIKNKNGDMIPLPYKPPYMQAIDNGYLDTWLLQGTYGEGYTSGFDEDIDDPNDELETRIDLIFLDPLELKIEEVDADVVGDEIDDMVINDNPGLPPDALLWPSDHAGVITNIKYSK
ncbi:MAG: endonuclease/exonuclease/phosphatase family protein [Desulfobacteraceae bacterium]|nr:endonuclease/exonuclease/phosphatase family protein [Desulfobacteraceae bacterium]